MNRASRLALLTACVLVVGASPSVRAQADVEPPAEGVRSEASPGPEEEASPPAAEVGEAREGFQRVEERAPRAGTPLISNKLHPTGQRFELTPTFLYSFNDKYVQHTGLGLSAGFHFFDWLAVEAFGAGFGYVEAGQFFLGGDETAIVSNVRQEGDSLKRINDGRSCAQATCEPQLPDMWSTAWTAGADVQWAPIYGKLSAVSEVDLTFQLYGLVGAHVDGIRRRLSVAGEFEDGGVRFGANYGVGLRILPWKYVALRAELRGYNGLNPNVLEHEDRDEGACGVGYTLVVGGERQCFTDISSTTMLQVGVSFIL